MDDVAITELEKIDADRVDGVGMPANGIPILMMKQVGEAAKDWADWDAAHEGGGSGRPGGKGESKADAASAVARAKQTIADHKAGKPVSAADLKNAHEVHEAHLAHEAKLKAEAEAKPKGKAKGGRTRPKAAKELAKMIIAAPHTDPVLLLKAVGADGEVDEEPDVEGGTRVLEMIAGLIIAEAEELRAGQAGEIADIFELACAAEKIWCWRTGEQAVSSGSVMPATTLMQSAAGDAAKGGPSADERREAASEGNALSDGSYPIRNEHELHAAAILARSGHGDVEGAKKLIARRAGELGVKNPLDDDGDTSKSRIAPEETNVDTVTQTGDLTEVVKAAEAKAAALEERVTVQDTVIKALEGRLAKVEAAPVTGGPVIAAVRPANGQDSEDHAAKARYFDEWAERLSDPSEQANYRQLAARERAKITVS